MTNRNFTSSTRLKNFLTGCISLAPASVLQTTAKARWPQDIQFTRFYGQVFHFNLTKFLNIMFERIQKRCTITETFEMSQLHRHSDHRSHRCDDFFNVIEMNQSDKLHGLPPYSLSATSSLKNKRNFTIIPIM